MSLPPVSLDKPDAQPPAPGQPGAPSRPPAAGAGAWRPWTAWAAFVTGFGVTIVAGGLILGVVALAGGSAEDPSPAVGIGLTLLQNVALIAAAMFFASIQGRPRAEDFGLRSPKVGRAVGLLVAVGIGFYALSTVWVLALGLDEQQTLPDDLGANNGTLNLLAVVFLVTIVAPIGEELFFRGYFFRAMRNWRGLWPAAIVTGLVFGAIHLGSSPVGFTVPLAFFGVGLCLLYHWTGSLYPSIALHALNNSIALGVVLDWGWEIPLTMVVSVCLSLALASLLGRGLGNGPESAQAPISG